MKLIRLGEPGRESPGVVVENAIEWSENPLQTEAGKSFVTGQSLTGSERVGTFARPNLG